MARRGIRGAGEACAGALVAACVLAATHVAFRSGGGGALLLQRAGKGGGLYGFQRDETAVGGAERRRAMDTLSRALGGGATLLTAKDAANEQLRWLRPFYKRQMQQAGRVWGAGPVAAAVDVEGRGVHYKAVNGDRQSVWAKAAMGSWTVPLDAQVVPPSQAREKADAEAVARAADAGAAQTKRLAAGRAGRNVALGARPAERMQQLAEIYGVRIPDSDAFRFFGKDYEKHYKKPSPEELHDYIQYLADHPLPPPVNATNATEDETAPEEGEEEEEKDPWPEKPKFGAKFKTHAATQWCTWPGGEEEVPCQIGAHGAWYDEPFSAGLWGRHTPNRETLVNNGVWRFPGAKPPKVMFTCLSVARTCFCLCVCAHPRGPSCRSCVCAGQGVPKDRLRGLAGRTREAGAPAHTASALASC
jgi:hypothetical protein